MDRLSVRGEALQYCYASNFLASSDYERTESCNSQMWAVYLAIVHTWTKVSESPLFKNSQVYTDISTSDTYATFRIQGTIFSYYSYY